MTDPTSATWTTSTSPSRSANSAMNSSGRLPSADWITLGHRRACAAAELFRRAAHDARERGDRQRSERRTSSTGVASAKCATAAATTTSTAPIASSMTSRRVTLHIIDLMKGEELREVMRRFPAPVAVVTTALDGERFGLTVGSLVSLSLAAAARRHLDREGLVLARADSAAPAAGQRACSSGSQATRRPALRAQRNSAGCALDRRRRTRRLARAARERARWRGSNAARPPSTTRATTRSSSARSSRPSSACREPGSSTAAASTSPRDRRGRLRPRRRHHRQRGALGRGPRRPRPRTRRTLERTGAGGHDGHELHRVVALHARGRRLAGAARTRSTARSSAGCSTATPSTCR